MDKRSLFSLVIALLVAGSVGCAGQSQPSYPGPGMASAQNNQPGQATLQGSSAAPTGFGQNQATRRTPFGVVANVVTNNPASAAVGRAWSTVARPTATPLPSSPTDVLTLGNGRETPSASLYTSMGKLAERNGNIDQARIHYHKALAVSPTDVGALLALARMEDRHGRLDEALKLYDQAVRVNPNHATAYNDLGLCLARKGDFPAAVASLSHAIESQPQRKLYRNNLATVLVELGRTDEALVQLSTVNRPAVAHYNMGVLLQKREKVAAATEHFAIAARLEPSMKSANAWLAKLRGQMGASVVAKGGANDSPQFAASQAQHPPSPKSVSLTAPTNRNAIVATPPSLVSANGRLGPSSTFQLQAENQPVPSAQPSNPVYPSLPPAPPVPQYTPNYPTFPQQASPMRYPGPATSAQSDSGMAAQQPAWPLHQPSQVPTGPLVHAGAEPPLPATVTNVYSNPGPQPLPPVQQAQAASGVKTW